MKKLPIYFSIGLVAGLMPASAVVLVAGWDSFPSIATSAPSHLDAQTAATLSAPVGGWDDWNNNLFGASSDGTFGSLSSSVATASTNVGSGSNEGTNLSLNRASKPGSLRFTLTNNSGTSRFFEGFYFDAVRRNSQSADTWTLTFSGAISGTAVSTTLTTGDMMGVTDVERNWGVDLTGLTDSEWEAGSDAIFTLAFTGGDTPLASGGGQETLIDNIGITIVPEPSSIVLLGMGGLVMLMRRRSI